MINQPQQDLRRAAAKAFIESLDQLHETLQIPTTSNQLESGQRSIEESTFNFDLNTFEQAVADIEAFIEQQAQSDT